MSSIDSFKARRELTAGGKTYVYYSLEEPRRTASATSRACPFR
jgi:aconitate hydratase